MWFLDAEFDVFVECNLPPDEYEKFKQEYPNQMPNLEKWQTNMVKDPSGFPLIIGTHFMSRTSRKCNITIPEYPYSKYNTELITFLIRRDPRIRPLTMLIKYWFRVNGFIGSGKFSGYGLFMMIVFYLQVS